MDRAWLAAWVRGRIAELEEELEALRGILEVLEGGGDPGRPRPGERVEEVRVGRRRIARVFKGEDYVRLAPLEPLALPPEARAYLEEVVSEIRAEQARDPSRAPEARLELREDPGGGLLEARIEGLGGVLELVKAKTALKHAAEAAWQYTRAARRAGGAGGA
ncbi:MAG: hypothetical protein GSR80_000610 [Desulfurococcales archaeon]|nr:hypothetical protein [Desulfurococcales archaeon]